MIAFTFPGQGSQAPGMGRAWVDHPSWRVVDQAAESSGRDIAAVLGLDDDKVDEACHSVSGEVWVANYNAPGQVVIAGAPEAVETAGTAAKDLGGKRVMPLKVAGAFHTPYMAPAQDRLNAA